MATQELVEVPSFSTSLRDKVFSDPTAPPFAVEADGHSMVHVMGHREVQYMLENPNQEFTRSFAQFLPPDPHPGLNALFAMDPFPHEGAPGRHTELRAIVEPWFRTRAVRVLEPRIRDIAHELLRDIAGRGTGEFDLARDLAYELSIRVICQLIGWDTSRADWWREKLDEFDQAEDFVNVPRQRDIDDEVSSKIEERRSQPQDELIDVLIKAEADGAISTQDIIAYIWMFIAAGTDTTAIALTNTIGLFEEFGHLEHVRDNLDDRQLLRRAIEETLRFGYNFDSTMAQCIQQTRFGDVVVEPGDIVLPWFSSANRASEINGHKADAADPQEFDINRSPNNHLAFGYTQAPHVCLGAALGRFEIAVALQEVLPVLAGLHRDTSKPLVRWAGINDGFAAAPFAFDQEAAEQRLPT